MWSFVVAVVDVFGVVVVAVASAVAAAAAAVAVRDVVSDPDEVHDGSRSSTAMVLAVVEVVGVAG